MSVKIHPSAIVEPGAILADNVTIGAFSQVHGNVVIGEGTTIGSYCEIGVKTPLGNGTPLVIGGNSNIRSHSVFYESSRFGDRLVTGHRVTVRENTLAGENLQIGTLDDIQGDCTIGDFVRFHSNVHIGKKSSIGNFVWIFPYAVLTNDPTPPSETILGVTLGDFSIVATMAVILPGVKVGEHALVAASACVGDDVPPHCVVAGVPAKIIGETSMIRIKDHPELSAYPWPAHFRKGYPERITARWELEFGGMK